AELPERKRFREVKRIRPVHTEFESKFQLPRMIMGFNTVRAADADSPALDVIQAILTGGRTGRLYKRLVEGEEVATFVSTGNYAGRYPGWFSIQLELLPDKERKKAEGLVLEELQRLRDAPIGEAELKHVQRMWLTDAVFSRESVHGLADSIARGVTTQDLDYLKNYLPRIMAVTAEDVQRVAKTYLVPEQRVVVWSVPRAGARGQGTGDKEARRTLIARRASESDTALSLKD